MASNYLHDDDNGQGLGYPVAVGADDLAQAQGYNACHVEVPGQRYGQAVTWVCTLPRDHGGRWHVAHSLGVVLAITLTCPETLHVSDGL